MRVLAVTPAPGWALEFDNRHRAHNCRLGFLDDQPGERMFAALLGAGGQADAVLRVEVGQADQIAEFEFRFGDGAGLVEGEGADLGQPFQGGAAFDQNAGPRQPPQRRDDGGRRRQNQAHGQATTNTDSVG